MIARVTLFLGSAALLSLGLLAACDDDGPSGHCTAWCEMAVSVELEKLDTDGCDLTDDPEFFASECREVCADTLSGLNGRPGDARDCIECVHSEVGDTPTNEQLQAALNGPCDGPCFEDGMMEFWDEFWDDWNYYDFDYDCD